MSVHFPLCGFSQELSLISGTRCTHTPHISRTLLHQLLLNLYVVTLYIYRLYVGEGGMGTHRHGHTQAKHRKVLAGVGCDGRLAWPGLALPPPDNHRVTTTCIHKRSAAESGPRPHRVSVINLRYESDTALHHQGHRGGRSRTARMLEAQCNAEPPDSAQGTEVWEVWGASAMFLFLFFLSQMSKGKKEAKSRNGETSKWWLFSNVLALSSAFLDHSLTLVSLGQLESQVLRLCFYLYLYGALSLNSN